MPENKLAHYWLHWVAAVLYLVCKQISLTKMTIDEYKDLLLEDEINIGYDVEEDLPDTLEDESWIDGLLTSGFHPIEDDELFGEPITGYSLY